LGRAIVYRKLKRRKKALEERWTKKNNREEEEKHQQRGEEKGRGYVPPAVLGFVLSLLKGEGGECSREGDRQRNQFVQKIQEKEGCLNRSGRHVFIEKEKETLGPDGERSQSRCFCRFSINWARESDALCLYPGKGEGQPLNMRKFM